MVNLKAKPYLLSDEDIKWVEDTIAGMSDEEKVGQLFFQLTVGQDEEYLKVAENTYLELAKLYNFNIIISPFFLIYYIL